MAKAITPRLKDEKYVGSHFTHEELMAGKTTNFLAHYSHAHFATEDHEGNKKSIVFKDGLYETSDIKEIKYLREHPLFDIQIFEGKLPEWYIDDQKKRNKYLTKDPMMYNEGE
jgi:hypothetical protein